MNKMRLHLTVDVEAWFQIENLPEGMRNEKDFKRARLKEQLEKILSLLQKYNATSTFFVLGSVAEKNQEIIKRIQDGGHEIASHGHGHIHNARLSRIDLKEDITRSKKILENITGKEIIGYRAPCFSITREMMEILKELGFKYDSSYNPSSLNKRYGKATTEDIEKWKQPIQLIDLPGGDKIYEILMPTVKIPLTEVQFPISGGGYGRLTPRRVWANLVKDYLKTNKCITLYMHPWEIDSEIPRIKQGMIKDFANYYGLSNYLDKLEFIIMSLRKDVQLSSIKETIDCIEREGISTRAHHNNNIKDKFS